MGEQQLQVYTVEERIKESSRRRAMIEYIMLTGETSSFECAHQLGKLCENRHLLVNLIPYNPTDVKDKLQCPSDEHMLEFRNIVQLEEPWERILHQRVDNWYKIRNKKRKKKSNN